MTYEKMGSEFEELIERRKDAEYDGECRLKNEEADAVLALIRASRRVIDGLNARIEHADHGSVPVFDGISELSDALRTFEPEEVE